MSRMSRLKFFAALSALLVLAAAPAARAGILVEWTGTVSVFNFGPYAGGETVSSSFILDDSVVPTVSGVNTNTYALAADSMTMTIGGDSYSGEDGRLQQFSSAATDFFLVNYITGVLAGSGPGGYVLTDYVFEIRGALGDLFADPGSIANGITEADVSFNNISLRWDDPLTPADENSFARVFLSTLTISEAGTPVPEPATLALIGTGLAAIGAGLRRRRSRA